VKQIGFKLPWGGVVMDEQSGESIEEKVMGEGIGESEIEDKNKGDEEIKEVDSRDKVKHNEGSDQLFLERMMTVAEQE